MATIDEKALANMIRDAEKSKIPNARQMIIDRLRKGGNDIPSLGIIASQPSGDSGAPLSSEIDPQQLSILESLGAGLTGKEVDPESVTGVLPNVAKFIGEAGLQTAGAIIGGVGGTVAGFGVGAVPGAAIGAGTGEALRQVFGSLTAEMFPHLAPEHKFTAENVLKDVATATALEGLFGGILRGGKLALATPQGQLIKKAFKDTVVKPGVRGLGQAGKFAEDQGSVFMRKLLKSTQAADPFEVGVLIANPKEVAEALPLDAAIEEFGNRLADIGLTGLKQFEKIGFKEITEEQLKSLADAGAREAVEFMAQQGSNGIKTGRKMADGITDEFVDFNKFLNTLPSPKSKNLIQLEEATAQLKKLKGKSGPQKFLESANLEVQRIQQEILEIKAGLPATKESSALIRKLQGAQAKAKSAQVRVGEVRPATDSLQQQLQNRIDVAKEGIKQEKLTGELAPLVTLDRVAYDKIATQISRDFGSKFDSRLPQILQNSLIGRQAAVELLRRGATSPSLRTFEKDVADYLIKHQGIAGFDEMKSILKFSYTKHAFKDLTSDNPVKSLNLMALGGAVLAGTKMMNLTGALGTLGTGLGVAGIGTGLVVGSPLVTRVAITGTAKLGRGIATAGRKVATGGKLALEAEQALGQPIRKGLTQIMAEEIKNERKSGKASLNDVFQ